jgi:TPR repeat protein
MQSSALSSWVVGLGVLVLSTGLWADGASGLEAFKRKDYPRAFQEWKAAAEKGDAESQFDLGLLYAQGLGVHRDLTQAERWYRLSATQGNAEAEFALGQIYSRGWGNPRDEADAIRWLQMANAVDSDGPPIDWTPLEGYGINRDPKQAVYWLRQAAESGHAAAAFELGRIYASGDGVPRDQEQAARWISAAAAQGYAPACKELGERFATGKGVTENHERAFFWLTIAFLHGDRNAEKARAAEAGKLSTEQASAEERAAQNWKPRPVRKPQK